MKTTNDRNEATGGQGWGRSVCVGGMAVLALGLASCAGSKTRPMAGAAMIDAVSKKDDQTRVRKSRIISVKGAKPHGREAHIAAGLTEVKVRYNWPQGGEQEVDLRFRAHPDRKYFVKYAAFPPSVDKLSGTTALSTSAEGFAGLGNKVIASGGHCQ